MYVRSFPLGIDTPLPNVSIADTGKLVHHVVEGGKKYASKVIAFYSEAISEGAKLDALGKCMSSYGPSQIAANKNKQTTIFLYSTKGSPSESSVLCWSQICHLSLP